MNDLKPAKCGCCGVDLSCKECGYLHTLSRPAMPNEVVEAAQVYYPSYNDYIYLQRNSRGSVQQWTGQPPKDPEKWDRVTIGNLIMMLGEQASISPQPEAVTVEELSRKLSVRKHFIEHVARLYPNGITIKKD